MLMKDKLLLAVFILLFSFANAQIGDEIKTYVDSTELIINNGRKMLVNTISANNIEKSEKIYDYVSLESKKSNYQAFHYSEELALNTLFQDWEKWLGCALNYNQSKQWVLYPNMMDILPLLYQEIDNRKNSIELSVATSTLSEDEIDLIMLYLHLIETGEVDKEYNELLKAFRKNYPTSKYNGFLKNYMPAIQRNTSWAFALGASYISHHKKDQDLFKPNFGYTLSLDFNVGHLFTSVYWTHANLHTKIAFNDSTEQHIFSFEENEKFTYFEGGIIAGYSIINNKRFHLAPYVTISGTSIKSNRFEQEDDKLELKVYNSFTPGLGIHSEFKLFTFATEETIYYTPNSYLSIKFDAGYNFITNVGNAGIAYGRISLVYGFGDF